MKRILFALIAISIFIPISGASGYTTDTHFDLSEAAVNTSVLSTDSTVLSDLGLNLLDALDQTFPNSAGDKKGITQLVQDGAVFEDNGTRALNHFYNPLRNEPLIHTVCSLPLLSCNRSPDWALEEQTTYGKQDDSFRDTRQFFLNALTLQSKDAREKAWGRTFQGLGQIMHHLQDMAQPQHVRNDPHPELTSFHIPGLENPSLYEHYTEQRNPDNVRARVVSFFGGYAPVYSSDDPSTFNSPRKLWHTNDDKGIADYTNRGFVSAGTNFDQIAGPIIFHQPDITSGTVTIEDKTALCQEISERSGVPLPKDGAGQPLPCLMAFIGTDVDDSYRSDQSGHNGKTSTFSIFDADLKKYFQIRLATLNKFNFEAAYPFLMKRAVGYSAGLVNYFFRGKVDMEPDPNVSGQYIITNHGTETLKGEFSLYYDDAQGNRYPVVPDPANTQDPLLWPTQGNGLAPQATMTVSFTPPTPADPAPKTPGEYMLVFQGDMGAENASAGFVGAVAAKKLSLRRPSAFLTPSGKVTKVNGGWTLQPETTLQYGNIDWKGASGVTLSWLGGTTRTLNHLGASELDNKIFSDGALLAEAPGPVAGAALQTGLDGTTYLLAVVGQWEWPGAGAEGLAYFMVRKTDTVYRKALPHGGWEQIGVFSHYSTATWVGFYGGPESFHSFPIALWHFNPTGTEAVSVNIHEVIEPTTGDTSFFMSVTRLTVPVGQDASFSPYPSTDTVQAADYNEAGELMLISIDAESGQLIFPSFSFFLPRRTIFFLDARAEVVIYGELIGGNPGNGIQIKIQTPQGTRLLDSFGVSVGRGLVGGDWFPEGDPFWRILPSSTGLGFYVELPPYCFFWDATWFSRVGPRFTVDFHSFPSWGGTTGLAPNRVWAAVDRQGNVAVGLRRMEAACINEEYGPLEAAGPLSSDKNLLINASALSLTELPGDPGVTGVIHPIGVE